MSHSVLRWRAAGFVIACALGACADVTPVASHKYSAVSVSHVQVLYQEPSRPYEVISLLSHSGVTRFASVESEIENLRKLAAAQGADAMLITSSYGQTLSTAATASAKAIKWLK